MLRAPICFTLAAAIEPQTSFTEKSWYGSSRFYSVFKTCGPHSHVHQEKLDGEGKIKLRTAFSRDQAKKVYVQHRIAEDADMIWAMLEVRSHHSSYGSSPCRLNHFGRCLPGRSSRICLRRCETYGRRRAQCTLDHHSRQVWLQRRGVSPVHAQAGECQEIPERRLGLNVPPFPAVYPARTPCAIFLFAYLLNLSYARCCQVLVQGYLLSQKKKTFMPRKLLSSHYACPR